MCGPPRARVRGLATWVWGLRPAWYEALGNENVSPRSANWCSQLGIQRHPSHQHYHPAPSTVQTPRLRIKFGRPAPQSHTTTRAVEVAVLGQRVVEVAAARAPDFDGLIAAHQAESIAIGIVAKAAARRASMHRHYFCSPRSQTSGSIARPLGRISKCRCATNSGSEIPTAPMTWPLITC